MKSAHNGKKMGIRHIVFLVLAAGVLGCGEDMSVKSRWQELKPGVYVSEKSVAIRDMAPDDVLYFVNGEKITKADYTAESKVLEGLYSLHRGRDAAASKSGRKFLAASRKNIPSQLVQRMLYLQAAKESGVQPAVGAEASFREKFIKTLPRRPKGKELEKAMGPVAYARLERKLAEDALIDAYRAHYWTNSYLTVSEEAISNKWEEVLRVNEKADKMNAKMRAKALEFRQKVLDGADFGELTLKYAKVHPEYGTNWTSAVLAEFTPEEDIYKWLINAKDGDVSEPLEMDDGLAVVKVVSRHPADLPDGFKPEDEYTMVRCTFYIFNKYVEGTSPETIRQTFLDEQLQKAHGELGKILWNKAVIELPNGDDFFRKAKQGDDPGNKNLESEKETTP